MRVKHAAVVAGLALTLMSGAAQAAYILDIYQTGANVVETGSGSINLTGATFEFNVTAISGLLPALAEAGVGLQTGSDIYSDTFASAEAFGPGSGNRSDVNLGPDVVFEAGANLFAVPTGYVSGKKLLASTSTFMNQTLKSLGVTDGTYKYALSNGDYFQVNVGMSPVPLPASAPMFGAALLALGAVGYGVKRKKAAATAV